MHTRSPASPAIEQMLGDMTLTEKIGQMTQVSCDSIDPSGVAEHRIGSVLSGGSDNPSPNTPQRWRDMVGDLSDAASSTPMGIPLIYGIDAVHGHSNVRGATVFPHNIGLGAIGDPGVVEAIGRATAREMRATGIEWTFAPTIAVAQDIRWGRTYESYGRDPSLVGSLGAALVRGLASSGEGAGRVLACAKHFVGDGAAEWDTVDRKPWMTWWDGWGDCWRIDQGDARISEHDLRSIHLAPYIDAIAAGAMSVMASYSSWNGDKLHGHRPLLTDVLKGELGFRGFVVSDWMGVDQLGADYRENVVCAINAGIDMVMVPLDYRRFLEVLRSAVADGDIPMTRIDDAVRRILRAKEWVGAPRAEQPGLDTVGHADHRRLAARAARRSAVLLKNEGGIPLTGPGPIAVAGTAADDIGLQCGGWTVGWQGAEGPTTPGTTLLDALRQADLPGEIDYDPTGEFTTASSFDLGIVCIAERPYAEGPGDSAVPGPRPEDVATFERMRARCRTLILIIYSGRPILLGDMLRRSDAVVAAWLPGSEATELPALLVGSADFEGTLTQPWPLVRSDIEAMANDPIPIRDPVREGHHR